MLLFMLYDFDCCLGSFPNDYKLLYFCFWIFTDGTCWFHWVFNKDYGIYRGISFKFLAVAEGMGFFLRHNRKVERACIYTRIKNRHD
jgi:hypothetical protein